LNTIAKVCTIVARRFVTDNEIKWVYFDSSAAMITPPGKKPKGQSITCGFDLPPPPSLRADENTYSKGITRDPKFNPWYLPNPPIPPASEDPYPDQWDLPRAPVNIPETTNISTCPAGTYLPAAPTHLPSHIEDVVMSSAEWDLPPPPAGRHSEPEADPHVPPEFVTQLPQASSPETCPAFDLPAPPELDLSYQHAAPKPISIQPSGNLTPAFNAVDHQLTIDWFPEISSIDHGTAFKSPSITSVRDSSPLSFRLPSPPAFVNVSDITGGAETFFCYGIF
jgi:hypothetical protein